MTAAPQKNRVDAWEAALPEEARWKIYERMARAPWHDAAAWAAAEYRLPEAPSRTAMYRFAARMRSMESAHRVEQAMAARAEAGALAAAKTDDRSIVAAYQALAQDLALRGDAATAAKYVGMALAISDRAAKAEELKLKAAAQAVKEKELSLAREKFEAAERRLDAVKGAVQDSQLSEEERLKKIRSIFGMK